MLITTATVQIFAGRSVSLFSRLPAQYAKQHGGERGVEHGPEAA